MNVGHLIVYTFRTWCTWKGWQRRSTWRQGSDRNRWTQGRLRPLSEPALASRLLGRALTEQDDDEIALSLNYLMHSISKYDFTRKIL
jgi:hypothetical protein